MNDEIFRAAASLQRAGKPLTIALVKSKIPPNIPIPLIVSTIQQWKNSPEIQKQYLDDNSSETFPEVQPDINSDESTVSIQGDEIVKFEQRLSRLEKKVDQLLAIMTEHFQHKR